MLNKAARFIVSFAVFITMLIPLFAIAEIDIYYLDVGQADAAIIICDGESLIIDGGNVDDSAKLRSFLTETLRLTSIAHVIASHPHEDHIGGLPAVFESLPVNKLYSPVLEYDSIYYAALIDAAAKQGIAPIIPSVGDSFPLGKAIVTFLSPAYTYEETNNLSLVVRISYGEHNFLFTGDAEWQAEDDLVASGRDLTSDVLKIGHHGSATSTTPYFLAAVYPTYAVISVAAENGYGHPVEDTMNMLKYYGVSVYRTDMEGDIYCHNDGHKAILAAGEKIPPWREVKLRCHDFRVDFCTRAYEAEIPIKTLQSWMGHEDSTMTLQVYTKLTKEREKVDFEKIANFMQADCTEIAKIPAAALARA